MREFILLSSVYLLLAGCGIKPSSVEPPSGAENQSYPATYPNPSTEP